MKTLLFALLAFLVTPMGISQPAVPKTQYKANYITAEETLYVGGTTIYRHGDTLKVRLPSGAMVKLGPSGVGTAMTGAAIATALDSAARTFSSAFQFVSPLKLGSPGAYTGSARLYNASNAFSTYLSTLTPSADQTYWFPNAFEATPIVASRNWVKSFLQDSSLAVLNGMRDSTVKGTGSGGGIAVYSGTYGTTGQRYLSTPEFGENVPALAWLNAKLWVQNSGYTGIYLVNFDGPDTTKIETNPDGLYLSGSVDIGGNLSVAATVSGNGSGLGNLVADNITTGILDVERLGGNSSTGNLSLFLNQRGTWTAPAGGGGGGVWVPFTGNPNDYFAGDSTIQHGVSVNVTAGYFPYAQNESTFVNSYIKQVGDNIEQISDQVFGRYRWRDITSGDTADVGMGGSGEGLVFRDMVIGFSSPQSLTYLATKPVIVVLSDETSDITTGNTVRTIHFPYAVKIIGVYAELATASGGGTAVTVRIKENGVSILSTNIVIDNGETTGGSAGYQGTAATAAVISDATIAKDAPLTFDIVNAGSSAKGLKVWVLYVRV